MIGNPSRRHACDPIYHQQRHNAPTSAFGYKCAPYLLQCCAGTGGDFRFGIERLNVKSEHFFAEWPGSLEERNRTNGEAITQLQKGRRGSVFVCRVETV